MGPAARLARCSCSCASCVAPRWSAWPADGNEALVRSLGVDAVGRGSAPAQDHDSRRAQFIDYQHSPLPAYLAQQYGDKPFDFVLDCVGTQALFVNSPAYLKPEGAVVNIGALEGIGRTAFHALSNLWLPTWLGGVPRRYIMFSTPPNRDDTIYLARLVEEAACASPSTLSLIWRTLYAPTSVSPRSVRAARSWLKCSSN